MTIVSLDEAKSRLGITKPDSDQELMDFIEALTVPVENYLHEKIEPVAITEDLELRGGWKFWLTTGPVISLTSIVSLDGTVTWNVANMKPRPSGLVRIVTGPRPSGVVTVTYQAGYATVPPNYREGALVILQHLWETQRGAGGILSGVVGPEEIRKTLSTFTFPNKAMEWLGQPTTMAR